MHDHRPDEACDPLACRAVEAFFAPDGPSRFISSEYTRGPWDPGSQHAGPPSALLARALEHTNPRDDSQIVRVTIEILRPVPIAPLEVETTVVRPGRKVELLTGELRAGGESTLRATAWRMRTEDIGVTAGTDAPPTPPGPDTTVAVNHFPWSVEVGYPSAMEWRVVGGDLMTPGPATVWMRMRGALVEGEAPSPLTRVMVAADCGNGVSAVLDLGRHLFVNTDLTVSLHRMPAGEWVCLDATTTIESHGIGFAASQFFDEQGPLGRGAQSLFVARR